MKPPVLRLTWCLVLMLVFGANARAHELRPAIADITVSEDEVKLVLVLPLEPLVAGIDPAAIADTDQSPLAMRHDRLRSLSPGELEAAFRAVWPELGDKVVLKAGKTRLSPVLEEIRIPETGNVDLPRDSVLTLRSALPPDGSPVSLTWESGLGLLALRQTGQQAKYQAMLSGGDTSAELARDGTTEIGLLSFLGQYVWIGVLHIVPKGLDHILFVLGLYFFARGFRPLLWQVTTFTLAHTITLALASLGLISLPGQVVEPLIAASITFVAVENILGSRFNARRILVIFLFGLLHGLGFASVLGDVGLEAGRFLPGLIGFNLGVEIGQVLVILAAYALVGIWFAAKPWYHRRIAVPASVLIGLTGAYWFVERVIP